MNDKFYRRVLQAPQKHNSVPSCVDCGFREDCGGLEGAAFLKGCFSRCGSHCIQHGCDLACPSLPFLFSELIGDVGGICLPPEPNLGTCFPHKFLPYIAQIDHGSSRDQVLEEPLVAVPLYGVFSKIRGKGYKIKYDSAERFRRAFKLSNNTEVLLTCVAPDQYLEDFWYSHVKYDLLAQLKELRIVATTVPNFSFMLDVPRTNALYNFGRMFRMAERMSKADLPVIFHLQASNERHWDRWYEVLRDQAKAICVALEFQTGASCKRIGDPYYNSLLRLQERLGRNLHPIVLAGGGRIKQLKSDFASFSVIDSIPFIKTVKRQALFHVGENKLKWHTVQTPINASLSGRLKMNINLHRKRLLESIKYIPQTRFLDLILA